MDINNINDEDEDVVIQGTSLYEHLHNLGYTDFESITVNTPTQKNEEKGYKFLGLVQFIKNIFKKLLVRYPKIVQDDYVLKKQMETILNAKALLSDHAHTIDNFLSEYNSTFWRTILLKITLFSTAVSFTLYIPHNVQYKTSSSVFGLLILFYVSYTEYSRVHAHRDLKTVIALQNDLFDLYKKGLKILKYGYKIKLNKAKDFQQFYDLTEDRLKYFQPIMENMVKCLEHVSYTYYHVSLVLIQLVPANVLCEDLLTKFDADSFHLRGEITYHKLRNMYYTYILVQSEMLYLLAVAYNSHTWQQSCKKVPEFKLAYIVGSLTKRLIKYKNKLAKVINAYYDCKIAPIIYKYKGAAASQWQDLYMHLYLASNKIQLAYGNILSILHNIDDTSENVTNEHFVEQIVQKLNITQKDIEAAKAVDTSNVSIVHDSQPEIMDEVFEEYIKEEYLKPLGEEDNEIALYNYKKDKSLFKNFMAELKDVLVDKQKSMSERESKALERMRKNITNESTLKDQHNHIDTSSQILSPNTEEHNISDQPSNDTEETTFLLEKPKTSKTILESEEISREKDLCDSPIKEKSPIFGIPLPENREFSLFLPPPFLKTNEETFIGSGENLEDEIIEVESEN
ncbi:uncharacterized protein LOC143177508 isoform X2 [Calliopsis andreniformis]|uniref:uncharacterized protein LOC143177508 isoform X2 n=1 Tax=Calliopsis andreniformis TaxID=337506 RepID=UPI003FCE3FFF